MAVEIITARDADKDDKKFLGDFHIITRRMAIPIGAPFPTNMQAAYDRALDHGWVLLLMIGLVRVPPNPAPISVMIYRLTDLGMARLKEINAKAAIDKKGLNS